MTGRERAAHARQLAKELNGTLVVRRTRSLPRGESIAMFREARVWLSRWDPIAYLTALHELGHIAHGHVRLWVDRHEVLMQEAEAWQWAFDHMAEEPTAGCKSWALNWCLNSYIAECARRIEDVPLLALTVAQQQGWTLHNTTNDPVDWFFAPA